MHLPEAILPPAIGDCGFVTGGREEKNGFRINSTLRPMMGISQHNVDHYYWTFYKCNNNIRRL